MQPKIYHFEGVAFIATPYRAGTYLPKDVFWRQFTITCQGNVEYPEDDPVYGSWWTPQTLVLGKCPCRWPTLEYCTTTLISPMLATH